MFKNPKENAAGYLIDQAGLKGTRVGNAEISKHHANFFVNHGQLLNGKQIFLGDRAILPSKI